MNYDVKVDDLIRILSDEALSYDTTPGAVLRVVEIREADVVAVLDRYSRHINYLSLDADEYDYVDFGHFVKVASTVPQGAVVDAVLNNQSGLTKLDSIARQFAQDLVRGGASVDDAITRARTIQEASK